VTRTSHCALSLLAFSAIAAGAGAWTTLQPGLEILQGFFDDHGQTVKFVLVKCDPAKNDVRVIDTYHDLGTGKSFAAFSIREVFNKTGALMAVNAGSTASFSLPIAVGLLMTHGKVVHQANLKSEDAGILCVAGAQVEITDLSSFRPQRCTYAVQRGPLLSPAYLSRVHDKGERYRRTVLAVDKENRLLVFVTSDKATWSGTAEFLYSARSGLQVRSALNMDADVSSGLLVSAAPRPLEVGSVDSLVASAVAIYKGKTE